MKINIVCFFLLLTASLYSENIFLENGKFGIEESKKGYINFYSINSSGSKSYLLDPGNYLNSRIFVKDSDKRFYLRSQGKYTISTSLDTFTIKWRTDSCDIIELYTITKQGFNYNIILKNRAVNSSNLGVYLMYDTYLGEDDNNHFTIDNYKIIKGEKVYRGSEIPKSIISKNSDNQFLEFRFSDIDGNRPDQVILGNWEQLAYSKKWPYSPKDGSPFSYGYYSINDSGIGAFYSGVNVNPGNEISYSFTINIMQDRPLTKKSNTEVVEDDKKWNPSDEMIEDEKIVDEVEVNSSEESGKAEVEVGSSEESGKAEIEVIDSQDSVNAETEVLDEVTDVNTPELDVEKKTEKEELLLMLEYIQKKKRGEDVSSYDFDEKYILEKLKERNE